MLYPVPFGLLSFFAAIQRGVKPENREWTGMNANGGLEVEVNVDPQISQINTDSKANPWKKIQGEEHPLSNRPKHPTISPPLTYSHAKLAKIAKVAKEALDEAGQELPGALCAPTFVTSATFC